MQPILGQANHEISNFDEGGQIIHQSCNNFTMREDLIKIHYFPDETSDNTYISVLSLKL